MKIVRLGYVEVVEYIQKLLICLAMIDPTVYAELPTPHIDEIDDLSLIDI